MNERLALRIVFPAWRKDLDFRQDPWGSRDRLRPHRLIRADRTAVVLAIVIGSWAIVDGVETAVAKAQELAGDRMVEVAAGDVGGQVLAAGLVDEVRMDVVPVVFGSGKRYFGSVDAQHLLEDPDVVMGSRVLHLRYRVRRRPI